MAGADLTRPRPVNVAIVAYHAADRLDRTLAALGTSASVTVVDNSQSDDVRTVAERHGAAYVRRPGNDGFAAGVNEALRRFLDGPPTDVLLLNPDARLGGGDIDVLAAALARDDRLAAVSPRLVDGRGDPQRVLWPFPSPQHAWLEAVGLARWQTGPRYAVGAALLLRWEALREVGLFDERFFLYAEEADWQRRATQHGWRSAVVEQVTATHDGAATSSDPHRRELIFHTAHELYIRKWFGSSGWQLYRAAVVLGAVARAGVLRGGRRRSAAGRALVYLRGPARALERYAS
ncbi:MAG TPA: glycosyltransferase family 2 protein [Gaiellaceae bacterium]|jgi:GT2 family glycosyltransferase|nr:glycosyltransferase family 2 protein [Gaiellaceae bacterium]